MTKAEIMAQRLHKIVEQRREEEKRYGYTYLTTFDDMASNELVDGAHIEEVYTSLTSNDVYNMTKRFINVYDRIEEAYHRMYGD